MPHNMDEKMCYTVTVTYEEYVHFRGIITFSKLLSDNIGLNCIPSCKQNLQSCIVEQSGATTHHGVICKLITK